MKMVSLPDGKQIPALGIGTWYMGEDPAKREKEIETIRRGLDRGVSLIDTAEMYGEGRSEVLIGEAIAGRRDDTFLVSKVYPHNAGRKKMQAACEDSLQRLKTDRLDLYLLHWRGGVPLREVVEGFLDLQRAGKIRYFGVSNLDYADMQELWRIPEAHGTVVNQVLYNLIRRGIEWDLLPWCRQQNMPVMAYSPLEQGKLLRSPALKEFSRKHGSDPAQTALAWLLAQEGVIVIPKTSHRERLDENASALDLSLTPDQLAELDRLFPPPDRPTPLAMI
jgi:diketogulonate reductase-like aldo/keto reductase